MDDRGTAILRWDRVAHERFGLADNDYLQSKLGTIFILQSLRVSPAKCAFIQEAVHALSGRCHDLLLCAQKMNWAGRHLRAAHELSLQSTHHSSDPARNPLVCKGLP